MKKFAIALGIAFALFVSCFGITNAINDYKASCERASEIYAQRADYWEAKTQENLEMGTQIHAYCIDNDLY